MINRLERKGQSRGILLAGIAVLTVALLIGMKIFMSDDTSEGTERAAGRQPMFEDPGAGKPPAGLNPAARSETGSGGGLEMFSKTNAGYYGEEESTAASTAPAAGQAAARSTAPAAGSVAAAKPKAQGTVIPRMQSSSFGAISPSNVAAHSAGQSMPDISGLVKQAQEQAVKKKPSGN